MNNLRTDEMDVSIDSTGSNDLAFRREHFGTGADLHPSCDTFHQIRIARLADADNAAVPDADVCLHDPPPVDDDRVRDHKVEHAFCAGGSRRLPHSVTDDFPPPNFASSP